MDEKHEVESAGLSRRSMLKRVGVGAAVVWSAPLLTTVGLKAVAGTPACPSGAQCPQPLCGDFCGCLRDVQTGEPFCHQGSSCGDLDPCNTTADCPDGWVCARSCCGDQPFCHPPCGTNAGAGVDGGPTSISA